jgi:ketosteroid isomerase-like protein
VNEVNAGSAVDAVRRAIATYFSSINGEDWDLLATIFHADAELIAPGTAPRRGGAGVASYYDDALRPYPEHRDEPTRVIYAGDVVTVEIHFDGRLANGRPMSFDAVDVFDFADGRVRRLSSWYDSHGVRQMLLEAATHDRPDTGEAAGPGAVTAARRRFAIGRARRGAPFRLDSGADGARARWTEADGDLRRLGLATRAVLLDLAGVVAAGTAMGPEQLEAAAAEQGVALRPGDALLLRTAAADGLAAAPALAGWLQARGVAALAIDGPAFATGLGLPVGTGWHLEALNADAQRGGGWDGLLVSLPGPSDDAANPVVFR